MNLQHYLTLNPASDLLTTQAYQETFDTKKIGSGQARGYFVFTGIWTKLRVIQADITHPLYALADATISTATDASSYFGMDINKADGVANRQGIATYVAAGVMTQIEADNFIAKTLTITFPFANTTQIKFDSAKTLITLETFPTQITVTNPAGAAHILNGRPQELHTIYVTILPVDSIAYADNLIATASSKNITYDSAGVAILSPFLDSSSLRGNFNIPANWSGTKAFVVNKSGLENHILYKLQSKFNRVFTAEVKSLV